MTMRSSLFKAIQRSFGVGPRPSKTTLVRFDGFDELDKTHALELFLEKSASDIALDLSRPGGRFGHLSDVEDLAVMEPCGYQYYLAPYLIQIVRNEVDGSTDLELTSLVLFSIREIMRIRGEGAFSKDQRGALNALVTTLKGGSDRWDPGDAFAEPLQQQLGWLETQLSSD